jgi:hypothetical protein
VDNIYELARDGIIAECVDSDEKPLDKSITFNRGTVLTLVHQAHRWGDIEGLEYCTVQIGGNYFNIPARILANSIMPKHS